MDKILAAGRRAGEPGLPVRSGRGVVRPAGARSAPGTFTPHFERLNYHVNVETDGDGDADHRGDGEAPRRRRGAARSGRRRWPGERPRRRPAQGPERPLPEPRRHAAGRLQSPGHQLRGRHGRRRPRGHRKPRRATTSGAPSASARTSSKPVGSPWSTASSTSCSRTKAEDVRRATSTGKVAIRMH